MLYPRLFGKKEPLQGRYAITLDGDAYSALLRYVKVFREYKSLYSVSQLEANLPDRLASQIIEGVPMSEISDALVQIAQALAELDLTVTIGDTNVTTPPVNVTTPPVNVTTPPVNVTTPPVNVDVTTPDVTTPPVNVDVTTPDVHIVAPNNITAAIDNCCSQQSGQPGGQGGIINGEWEETDQRGGEVGTEGFNFLDILEDDECIAANLTVKMLYNMADGVIKTLNIVDLDELNENVMADLIRIALAKIGIDAIATGGSVVIAGEVALPATFSIALVFALNQFADTVIPSAQNLMSHIDSNVDEAVCAIYKKEPLWGAFNVLVDHQRIIGWYVRIVLEVVRVVNRWLGWDAVEIPGATNCSVACSPSNPPSEDLLVHWSNGADILGTTTWNNSPLTTGKQSGVGYLKLANSDAGLAVGEEVDVIISMKGTSSKASGRREACGLGQGFWKANDGLPASVEMSWREECGEVTPKWDRGRPTFTEIKVIVKTPPP